VVGPPWKLSATPTKVTRHAPLSGEHNSYVFGELLGMSGEDIEQLQRLEHQNVFIPRFSHFTRVASRRWVVSIDQKGV